MMHYDPYLQWIDHQKEHMIKLVTTWSNINSHSMNVEGLAKQFEALKEQFSLLGGDLQDLTLPPFQHIDSNGNTVTEPLGKALLIIKRPHAKVKILLSGHMDTVYHKNSSFQKAKQIDETKISGPGVTDMKGGLVILLTALQALEKSPYASHIGWEVLITPDEEIGSPGSKTILERSAKRNQIGLVFEPAFPDGALISERGGSVNLTLVVHGQAAHAGRDFDKGASAIYAVAPLIAELETLNTPEITINVGELSSGHSFNIVPDLAIVKINIRSHSKELMGKTIAKIEDLVLRYGKKAGISMELHTGSARQPKLMDAETEKFLSWLDECAKAIDISLPRRKTRGVSDGNTLAMHGLATIDSLGGIGAEIHTSNEYLLIDSLTKRAKLIALFLMKVANAEFEILHKAPPIAL